MIDIDPFAPQMTELGEHIVAFATWTDIPFDDQNGVRDCAAKIATHFDTRFGSGHWI